MTDQKIKKLVIAALLTAMTCIATMIIKIPTPTFGYIHPGDGFVLLCGIILGPGAGALSAGIGSMFSDIFSGYASWAPATFLIKALTAAVAGFLFRSTARRQDNAFLAKGRFFGVMIGGIVGEALMVLGYFLYEAALAAFGSGSFTKAALSAGIVSSAAGIPFNILQGVSGIIIAALLLPILYNITEIRIWINGTAGKESHT